MLVDLAKDRPDGLAGDVCIIGAGCAGITLARSLLRAGRSVVLLESGGIDFEADAAALNQGENVGEPYYELEHARLRFFGGTTAIWGGRCAELDPIDFEKRSWVPHSGWPIGKSDLDPYYRRARETLDLPADAAKAETLVADGVPLPPVDPDKLTMPLWQFDERFSRFTFKSCRDLIDHPACQVVLHATVREIVAHADGKTVTGLAVRGPDGREVTAKAKTYIVAAGGIETPRIMLASQSVMPNGIGNAHDQVGRYFMEHPHARGGRIVGDRAWDLLQAFGRKHEIDGRRVAALLTPSEAEQERQGLLNTSLTIAGRRPADGSESFGIMAYQKLKHDMAPTQFGRTLWMRTKQATHFILKYSEPLRPWLLHRMGVLDIALVVRAEQAPNPDSRVLLDSETDALGMPRARLDWQMTELDVTSVAGLVSTIGEEFARTGYGKVEPADWLNHPENGWKTDSLISSHPIGGFHHMGTTRMGGDPKTSVTDSYCRVHGIDNLYVAGSSVFPTSGWANPTLSIIALSLRLADHIAAKG
ncbi:FAD-dependent oxidoreductase [Croceicoccus naphthovorans]|uniref:Oxidoreductase n=1 Tax=Croceicoccus naphthovorans TaxID=1348774 RepID=A0A0G3XE86_9SPHN|nr:GMC family oxidoreductase [Croceicoccus naphthovorans]AKM08914.1 oxidoreductase [Croceicoccus naphthovorans]MBB3989310.1 choline dehydrogenase-like flavoprotein [Croceicoccus naphthovorans]